MNEGKPAGQPWGTRWLDGIVIAGAIFTVLTHLMVWAGGSLDQLILACIGVSIAAAIFALWGTQRTAHWLKTQPSLNRTASTPPTPAFRMVLWAGAAAACLGGVVTGSILVWWAIAIGTLALATAREAIQKSVDWGPPPISQSRWLILGLSLIFATAVSVAHRSDADDSFYINLIVAAVGQPESALLTGDTLHGYANVAHSLPVFRLMTWEIFQAVLARITGLDPLWVAHTLIPIFVAVLVPMAWARLAFQLAPRQWPWITTFTILALLCFGDGQAGYGDFGVLRLQQGKAVMLQLTIPLCAAFAIEFAKSPSRWSFIRLSAVQIATLGLSASGLWLGPLVSGLGLLAAVNWRPRDLSQLLLPLGAGLAASAYPVALGLALRAATQQAIADAVRPMAGASFSGPELLTHATEWVLGFGPDRWLLLFATIAVTASGAPMLRRYTAFSGLFFAMFLFNPWTAPWVANSLTGGDTFFRVFWVLPLPLYVAALLTQPVAWAQARKGPERPFLSAAAVGFAIILLIVLPAPRTLSVDNGVRFAAPGPNLPPEQRTVAEQIVASSRPDSFVLAPLSVARWIPVLAGHPRPLMVRELYLDRLEPELGSPELDRRRVLAHLVSGSIRPAQGPEMLAVAIREDPLDVVALQEPARSWPALRAILRESPLEPVGKTTDYEIWARPGTLGN